jgi:hypothetical protein
VNQLSVATNTTSRDLLNTIRYVAVGSHTGNGGYFNGRIAEVAIWDTPLTQTQAQLFTGGAIATSIAGTDLRAYYRLNASNSTQTDSSGNSGPSVTLNGTATYDSDHPIITGDTSKYLKVLVHPDAASASGVEGIVWQAGGIAGDEIGEFTGKTFEATTEGSGDAERAVLKVPVADFSGGALNADDVVPCLVRNSSFTSGLTTGTVIEE